LLLFWVVDFSVVVLLPEFGALLLLVVEVVDSEDFSDTAGAADAPGAPCAPGAPAGPGVCPWHPTPKVPTRIARIAMAL